MYRISVSIDSDDTSVSI